MIWQTIIGFIGGPVIKGLIDAYQAKLKAGNTSEKIASETAAGEMAVQTVEIKAQNDYKIASLGRWYEPDKIMGYAVAIYFGKLLVYDKVLGLGVTDPLAGFAEVTANLIVAFYFAKRGFENIARIIRK
jgi:hypothetical protein